MKVPAKLINKEMPQNHKVPESFCPPIVLSLAPHAVALTPGVKAAGPTIPP